MAFEITIPRLGWSMEEGIFVEWLVEEGRCVEEGDLLFTLESEKAVQEIESIDGGILRILPQAHQEGDTVQVGELLGYLVEEGEPAPFEIEGAAPSNDNSRPLNESAVIVEDSNQAGQETASHAASVVTFETGSHASGQPAISPRAARVAAELGVDWTQLRGSGSTGRIRERDVRAADDGSPNKTASSDSPARHEAGQVIPLSPSRRTIAQRMAHSAHTTAPVTLTTTADATNLVNLRNQFRAAAKSNDESVPNYTDLAVKLVAVALGEFPMMRAQWRDDHLVVPESIDINFAVDTEDGLRAPVIRNVPSLNVRELAAQSRALIQRATQGRLSADELQAGGFTVTNLGAFGIDAFTPIINPPQCAVLGMGRIHRQPVVVDDQIVPREMINLSLTFDHRVVDGAPAARFLAKVRECIESPGAWLMG